MDHNRKRTWQKFLIYLALAALFVFALFSEGPFESDDWYFGNVVDAIMASDNVPDAIGNMVFRYIGVPMGSVIFVGFTIFYGLVLSGNLTREQEVEYEESAGRFFESAARWLAFLFIGVPLVLALCFALLVGFIWLVKRIWYAV